MKFFVQSAASLVLTLFAVQTSSHRMQDPLCELLPTEGFVGNGIRGITLAPIEDGRLGPVGYGTVVCDESVEIVAQTGATWISVTPFGRMDDLDSTDIQHYFEIFTEENEERIRRTIASAKTRGLKVALIPHLYVMSGQWRGQIDPGNEDAWEKWFAAYEFFLERFARLAEETGADLLSIGVEFKSSTNFYEARWRELIAGVREVYSGPLTYSANWDEIEQVPFWDELDLIGVNAFWPLAEKPGDGHWAMYKKALEVAEQLEPLSVYFDKPVVFTEMGVKSAADSALAPWEWPEHCDDLTYDEEYQATAYDAVFEAMTDRPWFQGLFIWKYFTDPYDETQETPTGFSPMNKLAEEVMIHWFQTPWAGEV